MSGSNEDWVLVLSSLYSKRNVVNAAGEESVGGLANYTHCDDTYFDYTDYFHQ